MSKGPRRRRRGLGPTEIVPPMVEPPMANIPFVEVPRRG
jgi:hypothetical protein